jgi:hypothetical protein
MTCLEQTGFQMFIHSFKMTKHVKGVVDPVFDFCWFQTGQRLRCKEIVFANLKR